MAETVKGTYFSAKQANSNQQESPLIIDQHSRLITTGGSDLVAVAAGLIPGVEQVYKFGRNPDIDAGAGATETVWGGGGIYAFPAAAEVLSVASADDDDNGATAGGALTLFIKGLDANYAEISETITLSGTAASTTSNAFLRVETAYVTTAGGTDANTGALTCTNVSADTVFTIPANQGRTTLGVYTVPAGKTAYMTTMIITVSRLAAATVDVDIMAREGGVNPFVLRGEFASSVGESQALFQSPIVFTEKTDIRMDATSTSANTQVSVSFDICLLDN